jgi:outer membrane murein-binding lipoprotein Lpp
MVMMVAAAVATSVTLLSGCTTSKGTSETASQKRAEIDTGADATLARLYSQVSGSRELAAKARGILVFPKILAAGLGIGGEYGEGALKVDGLSVGYYRTSSVTWGFQAGAQSKALIMIFMTQEALDKFRSQQRLDGWRRRQRGGHQDRCTRHRRSRECHCSGECLRAHQCRAHGRGDHRRHQDHEARPLSPRG